MHTSGEAIKADSDTDRRYGVVTGGGSMAGAAGAGGGKVLSTLHSKVTVDVENQQMICNDQHREAERSRCCYGCLSKKRFLIGA